MSDWPLHIDERAYYPIPESWVEHGVDAEGTGPRCYAVSMASICAGRAMHIRYVHPQSENVVRYFDHAVDHGGGLVPESLEARHKEWSRSLVPPAGVEPVDTIRQIEAEHLDELWGERVTVSAPAGGVAP